MIQYKQLQRPIKVVVYTDASFGNFTDGSSQGVYLIFLVRNNGCCNLLSWQSKRLKITPRSSLETETIAVLESFEATLYILELLKKHIKITKYQ